VGVCGGEIANNPIKSLNVVFGPFNL
jgi:hypothetical protein